jgi:hypothetical protein
VALSQQLDTVLFDELPFPYDKITGQLNEKARLVSGSNVFVTPGGKLKKRPGTIGIDDSDIALQCHRLTAVETLESTPRIYLLGSFYDTSVYKVYYLDLSAASPAWTAISDLRNVQSSAYPHEMISYRGKAYIKGFPATGDKLGSVVFDGTGGTIAINFWGGLGPTEPAHVVSPSTWSSASGHVHTVKGFSIQYGWKYTYSWVSNTNQVTCRAPLETNPDKDPSDTGIVISAATTGGCPLIKVQGTADTTRYPYINIYRTTDGGGTFYYLDQVANTGAADIVYVDKSRPSGAVTPVYQDPVADADIDTFQIAPSEVSNTPPPTCTSPKITGTDSIVHSTPMAVYAGRIWYGVNNYLVFSAQEEIIEGVPEECFPSGYRGNFFQLPSTVTNVVASADALYVFTPNTTYRVVGSDRETFNLKPFLNNIGHPGNHPLAVMTNGDTVVWLTHDFRIATVTNSSFACISAPLFSDIRDAINSGASIQILYWADLDKDYLAVLANDPNGSYSQWFYDNTRTASTRADFWFPPWTIKATVALSARILTSESKRKLVFATWDGDTTKLSYLDSTEITATDAYNGGDEGFSWNFTTHLVTLPPGNHVNVRGIAAHTPAVHWIEYDRTNYVGATAPTTQYYFDDIWTTPISPESSETPSRRPQSLGYTTLQDQINRVARRVALKMSKTTDTYGFELHNLTFAFNPGGGT